MHYVILVSQAGQQTYDDSERHYTYPARYNAALAPLMAGEPTVVILYESRRAGSGRGLQAYIGWTVVTRPQIFRVLKDIYRHRRRRFSVRVNLIAAVCNRNVAGVA